MPPLFSSNLSTCQHMHTQTPMLKLISTHCRFIALVVCALAPSILLLLHSVLLKITVVSLTSSLPLSLNELWNEKLTINCLEKIVFNNIALV